MWGEVNEPLVNDQWPHDPIFVENSHERPYFLATDHILRFLVETIS
jgi:hypothetical protein